MSAVRRERSGGAIPVGYALLSLLFVVVALPTVLRPPQEPPTETAELSPDAPPDQEAEPIAEGLNRGQTGTAGSGEGEGVGDEAGEAVGPLLKKRPRACRFGFGDPPRQTESVYAPPCAMAWSGDNGGSTYAGVDAGEVRVATMSLTGGFKGNRAGWVNPPQPNDNATMRNLQVWEDYFNQAFEFYGRRLRIYHLTTTPTDEAQQAADVATLVDTAQIFGAGSYPEYSCRELARRRLITFCPQLATDVFTAPERAGHAWSFFMDGGKIATFTAEYLCSKLVGKQAVHAGESIGADGRPFTETIRRFGVVALDIPNTAEPADAFVKQVKARCGVDAIKVLYSVGDDERLATAVSTLRLDGVTTVIPFNDYASLAGILAQADAQQYNPEWFTNGFGNIDRNVLAQLLPGTQWRHAFGFTTNEMERPFPSQDCFRAYRQIDTSTTPIRNLCLGQFQALFQLAAGIQQAGPNLTPETFKAGQFRRGYHFGEPGWALGGGFGPDDYTYPDDVAEIWWSTTAQDPSDPQGRQGAYMYVREGQRYKLGEIPVEDSLVFTDGVTTRSDF